MLKITYDSKDWKESWDFEALKRHAKLVGKKFYMCEVVNDCNDSSFMIISNQNLQQHQCQAFFDDLEMLICEQDIYEAKDFKSMRKLTKKIVKEWEEDCDEMCK